MVLADIWLPAGVVFGFQIHMVRWRIERELKMEAAKERVWFPLCDWLNVLSMIVTAVCVFVLPSLNIPSQAEALMLARAGFGLSAILLIGYLLALIGHYRLFVPRAGARPLSTWQEATAITLTVLAALVYLLFVTRLAL